MENDRLSENDARSLSAIIGETKAEVGEFVHTRVQLLRSELQEKVATLKTGVPLAAAAIMLLGTAYVLLTLALVGLVSVAFTDNPYRWGLAFLIVGVLWSLLGAAIGYFAKREFQAESLTPRKTLDVLRGDKIWLEKEVRNQI